MRQAGGKKKKGGRVGTGERERERERSGRTPREMHALKLTLQKFIAFVLLGPARVFAQMLFLAVRLRISGRTHEGVTFGTRLHCFPFGVSSLFVGFLIHAAQI